jgi:hypothetical protein
MADIARIISVAFLALLVPLGCGSPTAPWLGTWEGERQGIVREGATGPIAGTLRRVRIEIDADGKFTATELGIARRGSVQFGRERVVLKVEFILDNPVDKPQSELILELQQDGTALYTDTGAGWPSPVRLTKRNPSDAKAVQ